LLSTGRFFLVSIPKREGFRIDETCLQGWDYRIKRGEQIPNEISELISCREGISFLPLGRFDDPCFSVICIAGRAIFQRLKEVFSKFEPAAS
jgi:hypothetical protein